VFDIGWAEMLVLGIVVLLVMGPRELPTMLRMLGRFAGRLRGLSESFRRQLDDISREVDPRADLQHLTQSHPFEEDVGTPTLFDAPSESPSPESDRDASETGDDDARR
jgi:sec-independent protein translocase protein TatB